MCKIAYISLKQGKQIEEKIAIVQWKIETRRKETEQGGLKERRKNKRN